MRSLEVAVRTGLRKSGFDAGALRAGRVGATERRGSSARRRLIEWFMALGV
jgi:hypothetical protein